MKKIFLILPVFLLLSAPIYVLAEEPPEATGYQLLAPLDNYVKTTEDNKTTAGPYIEGIFMLIIAVAGGLAVIKIIYGGIQYMSTDAITGKSEAKSTIQNAIWGLLLAISAWLILNTINPSLTTFDFKIAPTTQTSPTTPPNP